MDAEVETACGAGYGEVSPNRVISRNGYRAREWDTRAGTVELAVPELRHGSYFPSFLEHRRRAERALASVVATSCLLGVSTRRVEKLAASLGGTGLSKSQVSAMAAELDELVEGFRSRKLDGGPYTFIVGHRATSLPGPPRPDGTGEPKRAQDGCTSGSAPAVLSYRRPVIFRPSYRKPGAHGAARAAFPQAAAPDRRQPSWARPIRRSNVWALPVSAAGSIGRAADS